jgi:hypothetical protein
MKLEKSPGSYERSDIVLFHDRDKLRGSVTVQSEPGVDPPFAYPFAIELRPTPQIDSSTAASRRAKAEYEGSGHLGFDGQR